MKVRVMTSPRSPPSPSGPPSGGSGVNRGRDLRQGVSGKIGSSGFGADGPGVGCGGFVVVLCKDFAVRVREVMVSNE